GAAVRRVLPALDQAGGLHPVEMPAQGDGLDLHEVRETGLVRAFVAADIGHDLPLGAGEAERLGALVELAPHQAGDVVHKEAELPGEGHVFHARKIVSLLIISNAVYIAPHAMAHAPPACATLRQTRGG